MQQSYVVLMIIRYLLFFAQEENERDFYKRVKETAEEITAKFQEFLKVGSMGGISDVYDEYLSNRYGI